MVQIMHEARNSKPKSILSSQTIGAPLHLCTHSKLIMKIELAFHGKHHEFYIRRKNLFR